jgi:tRNA-2-methylthio-N6-dimethylallyladenosine synthase
METTKRLYRVDREDIAYLRGIIESYDGMAVVRTVDPHEAVIELLVAPGCQNSLSDLLKDLGNREALSLTPWVPEKEKENFLRRRYYTAVMGCQMNDYDSDYLGQVLQNEGYLPAKDPKEADLILINTCTVRAKAEHKAYSLLGRMAAIKRKRPGTILGMVGCMAQQKGPTLLEEFPDLDLVLGTREIRNIGAFLAKIQSKGGRVAATALQGGPLPFVNRPGYFSGRVSSFVSIMQGCDNFCTYCVVPYVRGREVSRPPEEITQEVTCLVQQGVQEVTLLGQNVNSYTYGEERRAGFPRLLRALDRVDGLKRMRFTTSHPKDLSPELIQCFGELEHLCPHIHLPFQSGSDRILHTMRRGYTRETYMALVEKIRDARPDIAVTADVMVGFPGESEEDFELTLDLIRKIQFDMLFSFKYSDRKGTYAATIKGKIPDPVKAGRLTALQGLQREITLKKNRALVGTVAEVLVEGESKKGGQLTGRTGTNKVVNFQCDISLIGHIINVKIKQAFAHSLWAEPADQGRDLAQNRNP